MAAPLAGQLIRASNYPKVRVIKKAAAESVTSSTTLQNDDDFTISLEASKIYRVQLFLAIGGATAGDIKVAWAMTGGVVQYTGRHCRGPQVGSADNTATTVRVATSGQTTSVAYGTDGAINGSAHEDFLIETTTNGTAGTLTVQWAQNTSNATATTVGSASFMVIEEVDEI
jgi:hypothetical protein